MGTLERACYHNLDPNSLRTRLLLIIAVFILCITGILQFYTLQQFEKASRLNIEHEGLLLSDTLEASILPALLENDIAGIQLHIDRLVENRQSNDIEINILTFVDNSSQIVASNVPDNIEAADAEEHLELVQALRKRQANISIEMESDDFDPDDIDEDKIELDAEHPDKYFEENTRYLSITTPLAADDRELGGINIKLSLSTLDATLNRIEYFLFAAILLATLSVLLGLGYILNRQIFKPLNSLRRDMNAVAHGKLQRHLSVKNRRDEIGQLANTFDCMTAQLDRTRKQLHQYLNPLAIKEAYRRARENIDKPFVEEKIITVLFVDIVAFTSTAERLGPSNTAAYLNQFFDLISVLLVECGGYIDKFVADELICVFEQEQHADDAVNTARKILGALQHREDLQVRIGINSGNCIITDIGSQLVGRLDRTIIGDTVNIAQRLMTSAAPNSALLSLNTYQKLGAQHADIAEQNLRYLKGKAFPIKSYSLQTSTGIEAIAARELPELDLALAS